MSNKIPYIQEADEYQAFSIKTMQADYASVGNRLTWYDDGCRELIVKEGAINLIHALMGICTEAGEFADPIKKYLMYGKDLDEENLKEELGDLLWYIAIACETLNTSMSEVMTDNIRKLSKRYPGQFFTEQAAKNRVDKE